MRNLVRSKRYELALDQPVESELTSIKLRRDDKGAFDELKSWWSVGHGRQLTQWEAFTLLVAAAVEHESAKVPRR